MKKLKWLIIITLAIISTAGIWSFKHFNFNSEYQVGQKIDSLNNVIVFYNGGVSTISGRNKTADGYNLGLKYQCVEFVKRYYYQHLKHQMPDSYGNAKDFFDKNLSDGQHNKSRNLTQYSHPSIQQPKVDDLLIFDGHFANKFGHVAIVSNVSETEIEIIQQNPGPFGKSRETFLLNQVDGKWVLDEDQILGWLRKE